MIAGNGFLGKPPEAKPLADELRLEYTQYIFSSAEELKKMGGAYEHYH